MKVQNHAFVSDRDKKASVLISFLFILMGVVIILQSIISGANRETPETGKLMVLLSGLKLKNYSLNLSCFYGSLDTAWKR